MWDEHSVKIWLITMVRSFGIGILRTHSVYTFLHDILQTLTLWHSSSEHNFVLYFISYSTECSRNTMGGFHKATIWCQAPLTEHFRKHQTSHRKEEEIGWVECYSEVGCWRVHYHSYRYGSGPSRERQRGLGYEKWVTDAWIFWVINVLPNAI